MSDGVGSGARARRARPSAGDSRAGGHHRLPRRPQVVRPAARPARHRPDRAGGRGASSSAGPSGSGKSTFIRTINRLEEHQRGDIIVDGIELTNDIRNIAAVRSEIGMVFQSFNLFPHLTVLAERHPGAHPGAQGAPRAGRGAGHAAARRGWASRSRRTSTRRSSPAASSSGWPSPGPWPCSPRSCSSTSRPRPSTRR